MKDILIVEDGQQEQQRLLRLAQEESFSAVAVSSVEEAMQEIVKARYRLIILDLGLEDQSGLHLFRAVQNLPYEPHVVVLTGNPSTHLKQRFLDEGALAYLYKGSEAASNESLVEILKSALGSITYREEIEYRDLDLNEFLRDFVTPESRALFYHQTDSFGTDSTAPASEAAVQNEDKLQTSDLKYEELPTCLSCGSQSFKVIFSHRTQLPPIIEGQVCCKSCGALLDPELG